MFSTNLSGDSNTNRNVFLLGIYSHIIPPETTRDELLSMTDYDGRMEVAEDLMTLMIGDEITISKAKNLDNQTFLESDAVDN